MTFRRRDLERGFEPDSCFYMQNEERVSGRAQIDLNIDPPPDLVAEIDLTSPSLNKLPIYARVGIAEIWRYDGRRVAILGLADGEYTELVRSLALPSLTGDALSSFVEESRFFKRTAWMRKVRGWARGRSTGEE